LEELIIYRRRLLERLTQLPSAYRHALASPGDGRIDPSGTVPDYHSEELLAHVCQAEQSIFLPAIRRILEEETPLLDGEGVTKGEAGAATKPAGALLDEIAALHRDLLAILVDLPSPAWSRRGRHPRLGLRTLQWWVERCCTHGEEHLDRLEEAAGRYPAGS
jgi:hypothetical protein